MTEPQLRPTPPAPQDAPPAVALYEAPPPAAPPPALPEGGPGGNAAARLLSHLKAYWVMILFAGGLLGACLAALAYQLIPAKYTAYAQVRVRYNVDSVAGGDKETSRNAFITYMKTKQKMIRRRVVLESALRKFRVADSPTLAGEVDPVEYLQKYMIVEWPGDSEIIEIKLQGEHAGDIAKIVNAVRQAYYDEIANGEKLERNFHVKQLRDLRRGLEELVSASYGAKGPEGAAVELTAPPRRPDRAEVARMNQEVRARLGRMRDQKAGLGADLAVAEKAAAAAREAADGEPKLTPAAKIAIKGRLAGDPELKAMADRLEQLGRDINRMPAGPRASSMRRAWVRKSQELRAAKNKLAVKLIAQAEEAIKANALEGAKEADLAVAGLNARREALDGQIAKLKKELQAIDPKEAGPPDFQRIDAESHAAMLTYIVGELEKAQLELKARSRVETAGVDKAVTPKVRNRKKQLLGTAFAGLMGFALVGLGAVAYESRVQRVLSLADVAGPGECPVWGVIPEPEPGADWADHAPAVEAIDKARALILEQTPPTDGSRVLLVTGPWSGEGRAELVWQLGVSLARAGHRTLMIDCDLREPGLHGPAGLPNEAGVCELLRGEVDLRRAVQAVSEGLCVLPAGAWSEQTRADLAGTKPGSLFAKLREHFSVVVVNAHGLLAVSDTYLLSPHADATVLVARRGETRLPLLARARTKARDAGRGRVGLVYTGASADEALC